ncbi:glycosyltransferase family 2 protein [Aeromicrobium sp.]|uniref:glycosyltransferase family 2 protein n=1 Tax=Aeromicrobium sp. TaxID=1871063 RepID=UPI003C61777B
MGAVLVAHNGAAWLPKVLASFAEMFHAPAAWRVVDVSSTDGCADLLRDSFGAERITYAPSGTGFGEAVRLGVEALPPTDWVWLLHDDAAVLPGTLAGLLDVATSADDIAAVGPKIREWPSLRRLLEVGLTITNTGSRETGLETGEPDAGQHDRPRDVLAVDSAGMLVRRDVWDELDGFDPALPMYFDDIDFGWRLARAGYRTRTAPGGVMFHVEASRRGTRRRTAGDVPHWEPRRAALYTLLANTSAPHIWWQHVRLFVGSLMRVLGFLIGKDPESASDELLALRAVYLHPLEMRAARRARSATSRRSDRDIRELFPPFWLPYRHGFDAIRDTIVAVVRPEAIETVGRRSTLGDGGPDDTDALDDGPSLLERRPWLATVLVLIALSFVAGRGLFGGISGGALHGGALPPAPGTAGDWWMLMWERSHDIGLGSTSIAPVFSMLLGALATPVWFRPGLVITVLMLFAVPLAGLAAHRLGRRLTSRRLLRIVWAVSYALAVVATGAVAQGRIGTVVALTVLPIIANTAGQLVDAPGRQLGLRLGIWVAIGAAFAPVVLPLCFVGLLLLLVLEGRWVLRDGIIAAIVPLVLLGPWLVERAGHPFRMWWEAGFPVPGHASVLDLALGRAGGPGEAPVWLGGGLLVLAVLALIPRHSRVYVLVCWVVALIGLGFAVLGTAVTYTTAAGPAEITPWVGVPVVVWVGGLLTAVMFAAPEADGLPRQLVAVLAVVGLLLPVGTGAWWLLRGDDDPLVKGRPDDVPAFLAERPGDTVIISGSVARGVDVRVVADEGPFLGQEALTPDPGRSAKTQTAVSRLLARASTSDIRALERVGIDAIYAPRADPEVARRIDSAPMLEPAGSDRPDSRVWTLTAEPVRSNAAAPLWRLAVSALQMFVWVAAIILTAPVRRRQVPETLGDDEEAEQQVTA